MQIEINPQQQEVLDRAGKPGMSPEEVLELAFAVIDEQLRTEEWMLAERDSLESQIAAGYEQAERGELIAPLDAARLLRERRAKRQIG